MRSIYSLSSILLIFLLTISCNNNNHCNIISYGEDNKYIYVYNQDTFYYHRSMVFKEEINSIIHTERYGKQGIRYTVKYIHFLVKDGITYYMLPDKSMYKGLPVIMVSDDGKNKCILIKREDLFYVFYDLSNLSDSEIENTLNCLAFIIN